MSPTETRATNKTGANPDARATGKFNLESAWKRPSNSEKGRLLTHFETYSRILIQGMLMCTTIHL